MNRVYVVAGGGTGGHVYPALAIADALVVAGIDKQQIHFVGSKRGIESTVVPAAGYSIELLPGRGIKRSLSVDNVGAILGLVRAMGEAIGLVRKWKPAAVVSVGGYAAASCAIAAVILRVPLILAESNAVPGATHRLVARFAKASAIAYPNTPMPRAVVTGNPVRDEIIAVKRTAAAQKAAKKKLGVSVDRILIGIFGGSLGAASINRAAKELCEYWHDRADLAVFHVVGRRDWKTSMSQPVTGKLEVHRVEYESHMEVLYAAADVVVCRSGATTSAEIAVAGVPSVLIPLPGAPGDHQTANADALRKTGAAELLIDADISGPALAMELEPIVSDAALRTKMSAAAKSLGHPAAAAEVAKLVLSNARQ